MLHLNQAAVSAHRSAHSEQGVLGAFRREIAGLGMFAAIHLMEDGGENLVIRAMACPEVWSEKGDLIEAKALDHLTSLSSSKICREVVEAGEPQYIENNHKALTQILPERLLSDYKGLSRDLDGKPAIFAPLESNGEPYGVVWVSGTGLSAEDVPSWSTFCKHLSIALDNTRLLENERQRAKALRDAARAVGSSLSLDAVLEAVLEQLSNVLTFDSGSIMLVEDDCLIIKVWRGYDKFNPDEPINDPGLEVRLNIDAYPILARLVRQKEPIVIADVHEDASWRGSQISQHVRSWLGMPLWVRGQGIGLISLDRRLPGGFDAEEIALAQTFAVQAAAAIDNARLFEAEEQRAGELEVLRQASLSLTSSLELKEVLDAILKSVLQMFPEANNGHIFLYNDEHGGSLKFGASLWADGHGGMPVAIPRPEGLTYTVVHSGEVIAVSDMADDPLYQDTPDDWKGGIIGIPLKIGQNVVGVMNIAYKERRTFLDSEMHLLRLLGDQAAIAIENARLFEEAATERLHLGLLYDVGQELAESLDAHEILKRAVSLTCRAMGGMVGEGFLYIPEEHRLTMKALYGREASPADMERNYSLRLDQGLAGWVARKRQPVNVPNAEADERWHYVHDIDQDVMSVIAAPVLAGERLMGVISVFHAEENAFTSDHLDLIQAICQEVGLALSNADRYQQVQRRLAEITLIQDLSQTFSQRLELQVLLDEVVRQLDRRLGYPQVRIFLIEEDELVLKSSIGPRPAGDRFPISMGVIGRVARTGQVTFIPDVSQDPDYNACVPETVAELAVPIYRGKSVVGIINIESDRAGELDVQDRDLLQLLAGQISIALENAVLYGRVLRHAEDLEGIVAQRTAELAELYELSQKIGYTLSYDDLMTLLVRHLHNAVHSDAVMGCLLEDGRSLVVVESDLEIAPRAEETLKAHWKEVLKARGVGEQFFQEPTLEIISTGDSSVKSKTLAQISNLINAPIFAGEKFVGVLVAGNGDGKRFGEEQRRLLTTFANQASTAFQRLQTILAAEQKRLENLVQHLPVGVLLLDADRRLLVANPLGHSILSILNGDKSDDVIDHLGPHSWEELAARKEDPVPVEIIIAGPPRQVYEAQARMIGEENRQWILTLREVTQERDYQTRIQMQDRLATVGQLAAGIAHDFNNIMAAILVYADLLHSDPGIPRASKDRLLIIQQQVERAASLIRQILDFSRRSVMEQSSLDLLPFVKELDKMLARVMPETIQTELSFQAGDYQVHADPTRIQQVFMNLALNARDAMPEGGELHFNLSRLKLNSESTPPIADMPPGDWIRITISDSGIGISQESLPHIFEPFFTTKPVGQGTGLGLAQVYGIIKQHEGYIDVHSQVGKGTAFNIYLPALPQVKSQEKPTESRAHFDGGGETVLVAEDDRATLNAIRDLLEAKNYEVVTARNGMEALKCFDDGTTRIDLVVSDVVMPQMGGVDLYYSLREQWPDIKMLFVTGHPLEGESQTLLEKGAVHWLQKPFSIRELSQAVRALLDGETD